MKLTPELIESWTEEFKNTYRIPLVFQNLACEKTAVVLDFGFELLKNQGYCEEREVQVYLHISITAQTDKDFRKKPFWIGMQAASFFEAKYGIVRNSYFANNFALLDEKTCLTKQKFIFTLAEIFEIDLKENLRQPRQE